MIQKLVRNTFSFLIGGALLTALLLGTFGKESWAHLGFLPQISVLPKSLPEPERELLRYGDRSFTRFDFVNFLRLSQKIKETVDSNQRVFFGLTSVFESLSVGFSGDLLTLMPDIQNEKATLPESKKFLKEWSSKQPIFLLSIQHLAKLARVEEFHKYPAIKTRLEYFETAVLASYLEDFIKLTDFEPNVKGFRSFISGFPPNKRSTLDKTLKNPQAVPFLIGHNRWKDFRTDLLKHASYERLVESINEIPLDPKTVLAQFEGNEITWEQFTAIHGAVDNERYWNTVKKARIGRIILNSLLAAEVRRQAIIPRDIATRIELSKDLFLAMEFLSIKALKSSSPNLDELLSLGAPIRADLLLSTFKERTSGVVEKSKIDTKFMQTIEWMIISPYTEELPDYL